MARSRRSRRTASRRRNSGGGGGGGGGGGCGSCSCCQPCGVCGVSLKCAAFIISIIHIVWGALWVLSWLSYILDLGDDDDNGIRWGFWGCWMLLSVFWLVLGILLLCAVRCTTDACRIHFYLIGVLLTMLFAIILGIIQYWWEGGHKGGVGNGAKTGIWFSLFICFWWWYPYWCIYAYYYQLTGKSWCNCGCH